MILSAEQADALLPLHPPLPQITASFLSASSSESATARADALEVQLRQHGLLCIQAVVQQESDGMSVLKVFWKETLQAIYHIIYHAEKDDASQANQGSDRNGDSKNAVATSEEDKCKSVISVTSYLRKLPVILLDDIVDTLSLLSVYDFWMATVPGSLLFDDLLWSPTASLHPCWLPLLKTANKFLRRLQAMGSLPLQMGGESAAAAASNVLQLLSTVYPMTEKSATRVWGSHNADNLAVLEEELEFAEQQKVVINTATAKPHADYSFYETFWRLQHDFRNPNGIVVADFLHRLKIVLHSLESHAVMETIVESTTQQQLLLPFLTSSRLLPIQLTDPGMRTVLLTQFWIVAHHLMSQVPPLRAQLQAHLTAAEPLFSQAKRNLLTHILECSEPQWQAWKQNKCLPDLEQQRRPPAAVTKIRKRKRTAYSGADDEEKSYEWMGADLRIVSQKMRASVPTTKDHLQEYVEALDPDSGIEEEYHPKRNAVFTWRALRLLAADHLEDFGQIRPDGDFETMVRTIYQKEHGVDIPGEGPAPYDEDYDEGGGDDEKEAAAETAHDGDPEVEEDPETDDKLDVEMEDVNVNESAGNADLQSEGHDVAVIEVIVENGKAMNGVERDMEHIKEAAEPASAATTASVRPNDVASKGHNGKTNVSAIAEPESEASRSGNKSLVEKSRQQVTNEGRSRAVESVDHSRSRSDNSLPQREAGRHVNDARRESRDLGHFSGSRREPSRDHGRRDDYRGGDSDPVRRGDERRGVGDSESTRRDDRRGGDSEPRRDDRRSDRGEERTDRGRSDRSGRGGRHGGRTHIR